MRNAKAVRAGRDRQRSSDRPTRRARRRAMRSRSISARYLGDGTVGVRLVRVPALLQVPDADGRVRAARHQDAAVEALEGERVHAGLVSPEGGCRVVGGLIVRGVAAYACLAAVEAEVGSWPEGAQELRRLEAGEDMRSEVAGRPLEQELIHASVLVLDGGGSEDEGLREEEDEVVLTRYVMPWKQLSLSRKWVR